MAEADAQAMFHRTLGRPIQTASDYVANVYGTAYTFLGNRKLAVTSYVQTGEQRDFRRYATQWELQHSSVVIGGRGTCVPVVDMQKLVVGYVGSFDTGGQTQIFVPPNLPKDIEAEGLPKLVSRGVRVLAHQYVTDWISHQGARIHNPAIKDTYVGLTRRLGVRPLDAGPASWDLVTDIEGNVVQIAGGRTRDNSITPHWVTPIDLVMIPKLVGGIVIKTLFRKSSYSAAVRGIPQELGVQIVSRVASRRVGPVSAREMEQHLLEVLAQRPELARLMRASRSNGEALQREVLAALQEWQYLYGQNVKWVENGVVQELTRTPQNFLTLRGNELWIEKQVADVTRREVQIWLPSRTPGSARELVTREIEQTKQWLFFEETTHELAAHALVGHGGKLDATHLAYIAGRDFKMTNAMKLLEHSIQAGSVARALQAFLR
jgi:hypothetical protein